MDKHLEELIAMQDSREVLRWYGWGSPVGLGLLLISVGVLLWLLHLAGII